MLELSLHRCRLLIESGLHLALDVLHVGREFYAVDDDNAEVGTLDDEIAAATAARAAPASVRSSF
jgi:hypothetical protein